MANREMSEEEIRERVRALLAEAHPDRVDQFKFRGKQYDHGLAWVHFPEGYGGLGVSPRLQAVVNDEIRRHAKTVYDDMMLNPIGIGMGAPTVLTHGTDWMKKNLLQADLHRARTSGASCSANRARARTSPASPLAPCATATTGSSTARRCGRASRTSRSGGCCSLAPIPTLPSTPDMSYFLLDHARAPAWRCARSTRSPARRNSTRSFSTTCGSRPSGCSAPKAMAGRSRSPH